VSTRVRADPLKRGFNFSSWFARWESYLSKRKPSTSLRPRIFILPTAHGLLFACVLFAMLLGSINYSSSLGYALTFLLTGLGHAAILHTHRNLARLEFYPGKTTAVFAGEPASFNVLIKNAGTQTRHALVLQLDQHTPVSVSDVAPGSITVTLSQPSARRGWLPMAQLTLSTRFPLGLLCAWTRYRFNVRCLIYPAPQATREHTPWTALAGQKNVHGAGDDDFAGQRSYRDGDALARVNWKAAAAGRGLLTKEFTGGATGGLWLDWDALSGVEHETRLCQLCQQVLDADRAGLRFGLRLPGQRVGPGSGPAHRHDCLAALALFALPEKT
jgi:uncharacterized protein (DUF58 family)